MKEQGIPNIWKEMAKNKSDILLEAGWVGQVIGNTSTNTDIRTLTTPGFFRSENASNLFSNLPGGISKLFNIQVMSVYNNPTHVRHILYEHNTNKIWSEVYTGTWSSWELLCPTGVKTFNGREGIVVPMDNDYTYSQVGLEKRTVSFKAYIDSSQPTGTKVVSSGEGATELIFTSVDGALNTDFFSFDGRTITFEKAGRFNARMSMNGVFSTTASTQGIWGYALKQIAGTTSWFRSDYVTSRNGSFSSEPETFLFGGIPFEVGAGDKLIFCLKSLGTANISILNQTTTVVDRATSGGNTDVLLSYGLSVSIDATSNIHTK